LKLYLYGGGGHAKVILDILHKQNRTVVAIVDDAVIIGDRARSNIHGIPILPSAAVLENVQIDDTYWIVTIGNNKIRQSVVQKLASQGAQFTTAVHSSAQIGFGVTIAPGTVVMANAVINPDAQIGEHAIINTGAIIDHDCQIADYAHIAPGCSLCGQVQVGEGALLGVGTKVKPLMKIGEWTTCGAGSIVVKSLPSHVIAYGCPARVHHVSQTPNQSKNHAPTNSIIITSH
jgi:sugar O-acyltransferase (sialic acid O-acetyltransferase NeuD family)